MKQSNLLGKGLGLLKLIAQQTNIYVQFAILGFSSISAYAVIAKWVAEVFNYNLQFWLFAIIVFILIVILALFEWSLGLPSTFSAWNNQWWEHKNPLRPKIDKIESDLKQIKDKLGIKDE